MYFIFTKKTVKLLARGQKSKVIHPRSQSDSVSDGAEFQPYYFSRDKLSIIPHYPPRLGRREAGVCPIWASVLLPFFFFKPKKQQKFIKQRTNQKYSYHPVSEHQVPLY